MSVAALTPQILADTTLQLLIKEEDFLQPPRSSRQYREYDVQFLLWRELLNRGYDVWLEDRKIDMIIRDGMNVIATVELKAPWHVKKFRDPNYLKDQCGKDFKKHSDRVATELLGQCYSIWILAGIDESRIQECFTLLLDNARMAANNCALEVASSNLMPINPHPEVDARFQKVYVVRVYKDSKS